MFWRVCCQEGILSISNSCKYLINHYALVTSIPSDHFFPDHFPPLLVKSLTRPMGRAGHSGNVTWEGERYYWNPRLIPPMVIFLPVLIPFSARLCSLLLTPFKIAMSANIQSYSSCLFYIYIVSHPHKPLSPDPLSTSIALFYFKHLNSGEQKLGHSLITN